MRKILLVLALFFNAALSAQNFDWWANLVKWDGVTSWKQYITYSARYMGPNAIPVPSMANGSADSTDQFSIAGVFHFSEGDHAQNLTLSANYCLVKNLISFDAAWIPVEWYQMSHSIKEERHVFSDNYYDRKAKGDVLFNMNIQLLNRWRRYVQLALRAGYRFPTSSGVGAARYTNAPGYYFDLSAGKFLSASNRLKLTGMLGFYVWQLNEAGQDDAFMFGAGLEYNHKGWHWEMNGAGYLGYLVNGDRPIVFRSALEKKFNKVTARISFSQGLNDYKYTGLEAGTKFIFAGKKNN